MILSGLKQGAPGVILTNERTSSDVRRNLQKIMPNFPTFEKNGKLKYIDAYTATVKLKGKNPFAIYVDPSKDPGEMKKGLSKTFEAFGKKYFYYRIMFDSLSPVLRKFGLDKTLGFLNLFITKAKANNAIVFFDLSQGVHQQSEINAIEEVMDGVIEFKSEAGGYYLRVKGMGEARTRDWVEFKHSPSKFEVTGSFALQKIA
jgi:KaiC/GvpD/RAD55 family RecA-like ATPase